MRIGFIGLGTMGLPMACNIANTYSIKGYNRSKINASLPFDMVESITDLVKDADVLITMVPDDDAIESIYQNIRTSLKERQIWLDMSTISHEMSLRMHQRLLALNCEYVDAPVVKSKPAAVAGTLGIYFGGSKTLYTRLKPLLECMGQRVEYMGEAGNGIVMKLIHNMLVAYVQYAVNHALTLAEAMHLDRETVMDAVKIGGGQNFYLDAKKEALLKEDYPLAFSIKNMHKDLGLIMQMLKHNNLPEGAVALIKEIYDLCIKLDLADQDFSATFKVFKDHHL